MQMDEARGYVFQALRETGWNQMSALLGVVGLLKARAQGINTNLTLFVWWQRVFSTRGGDGAE